MTPSPADLDRLRRRRHATQAMATHWTIWFDPGIPDSVAAGAAEDAFRLLERLEALWSRFRGSSDIARLNAAAGQMVVIAPETRALLEFAERMRAQTGGAFDIAWSAPPEVPRGIEFDPQLPRARLRDARLRLDLGGIGKGAALDVLADHLHRNWALDSALLEAGGSTALALKPPRDTPGWPVSMTTAQQVEVIWLGERALSASGPEVRGAHIVDPRTGRPRTGYRRVWALAPTAAEADALSTAFAAMAPEEVSHWFRTARPGRAARLWLEGPGGGELRSFGQWPPATPAPIPEGSAASRPD
ncbi:MAG: FAD:protein FMN transferase [Kiritimatiellae bacterium]|nr:FAD:protein FMN transferase [Kiritimatiellia bacterium]